MVGHIQWSLRSHGGAISSNSTLQQFPIRYFDFTPPGAHRQTLNRTVLFFNHWLMLRSRFQDRRAVDKRNWERDCKITHTHMKKVFFVQKAHPPIKFLFSHLSGQAKCFGLTRKMPSVIPLKKKNPLACQCNPSTFHLVYVCPSWKATSGRPDCVRVCAARRGLDAKYVMRSWKVRVTSFPGKALGTRLGCVGRLENQKE